MRLYHPNTAEPTVFTATGVSLHPTGNGPAPNMTSNTPFLTITFRPDLGLLIVRWLRDVSHGEIQQGYAEALATARQHAATCWLVDSRRRTQSDAAIVEWLAQSYLPNLSSQLEHKPVFLACLVAATWQPTETPATPLAALAQTAAPTNSLYQVQLFSDEGNAMQWLQDNC